MAGAAPKCTATSPLFSPTPHAVRGVPALAQPKRYTAGAEANSSLTSPVARSCSLHRGARVLRERGAVSRGRNAADLPMATLASPPRPRGEAGAVAPRGTPLRTGALLRRAELAHDVEEPVEVERLAKHPGRALGSARGR